MFSSEVFGFGEPYIEIVREPKKYGYRFRYKTEGNNHGGILAQPDDGVSSGSSKTCPKIKIHNLNGKKAKVVLRLAAEHNNEIMHIHSLVYNKEVTKGFHILDLNEANEVELENVAVQQEKKNKEKDFLFKERVLQSRYLKNYKAITPSISIEVFVKQIQERADGKLVNRETGLEYDISDKDLNQEASALKKDLNVHSVVLAFHGFVQDKDGKYTIHLPTVYSIPIYDGKNKAGCEYKIQRMSTLCGSANGGDEVWMLCDKFNMSDVEVHFFDDNVVPWNSFGIFSKSDVHSQRLVIFRTPPYKTKVLNQPAKVKVKLRARSDHRRCSNHFDFTYMSTDLSTANDDGYEIGKKRKKIALVPDFSPAQYNLSFPKPEEQLINIAPQQLLLTDDQNFSNYHDQLNQLNPYFFLNECSTENNDFNQNLTTDGILLGPVEYLTIQDDTTSTVEEDNETALNIEDPNIADATSNLEDAYLTFRFSD